MNLGQMSGTKAERNLKYEIRIHLKLTKFSLLFLESYAAQIGKIFQRFGTNYRPVFKVQAIKEDRLTLEMRPISCPETSGNNYQYMSRNIPEGRRSCLTLGRKPAMTGLLSTFMWLTKVGLLFTVYHQRKNCEHYFLKNYYVKKRRGVKNGRIFIFIFSESDLILCHHLVVNFINI
jgi:hypothetical protein